VNVDPGLPLPHVLIHVRVVVPSVPVFSAPTQVVLVVVALGGHHGGGGGLGLGDGGGGRRHGVKDVGQGLFAVAVLVFSQLHEVLLSPLA
jgi:hypothetical protein